MKVLRDCCFVNSIATRFSSSPHKLSLWAYRSGSDLCPWARRLRSLPAPTLLAHSSQNAWQNPTCSCYGRVVATRVSGLICVLPRRAPEGFSRLLRELVSRGVYAFAAFRLWRCSRLTCSAATSTPEFTAWGNRSGVVASFEDHSFVACGVCSCPTLAMSAAPFSSGF